MTKRVAWFTGKATNGSVTPCKVYDVFNEDDDSFNLKDDTGGTRFCCKKACAHICRGDWVLAAVVEEVKEAVTEVVEQTKPKKAKKWSAWLPHTNDEQPVADDVIVKVKFSDGTTYKEEAGNWSWFKPKSDGDGSVRFYKVKLKDQKKPKSKWTKNTGVCPVDGNVKVEFKRRDGQKSTLEAYRCTWRLSGEDYDIIKWRLAD